MIKSKLMTMKRIGNLFDKIANMDNLILADIKARRGKKDSYGIRLFDKDKEGNLSRLLKSLQDGTFKTSKYRTDIIYEPKERVIFKLPYYPDRILHHAIMNVMEPIWVSIFTSDTTSCIKGRGITEAYKGQDGLCPIVNPPIASRLISANSIRQ